MAVVGGDGDRRRVAGCRSSRWGSQKPDWGMGAVRGHMEQQGPDRGDSTGARWWDRGTGIWIAYRGWSSREGMEFQTEGWSSRQGDGIPDTGGVPYMG